MPEDAMNPYDLVEGASLDIFPLDTMNMIIGGGPVVNGVHIIRREGDQVLTPAGWVDIADLE
jgi:hypothetical protein